MQQHIQSALLNIQSIRIKQLSFLPKNSSAKLTIPATVKVEGKSVPVSAIALNAFKGVKKLKIVTIGKNIKTIGKNAFRNCKKLKTISIKTSKLSSSKVGSNAFKVICSKATIKVPKKKLTTYKKLLKKKGIGKKVKITK
ncbi:MAG: leucine-rich repeat protein [Blautia sp.]|nr:leucine-rich repeat protein [Blautia sp.]